MLRIVTRSFGAAAEQVSTYAGSGAVGFKDGDTAIAEFSYPAGLASIRKGTYMLLMPEIIAYVK